MDVRSFSPWGGSKGEGLRLADNHRRVAANLDKIITALENLPQAGAQDD